MFLGHASRSTQNALVPTKIISNALGNGNVAIGWRGRSVSPALRVGPELLLLPTTARGRVGRQSAVGFSVKTLQRSVGRCHPDQVRMTRTVAFIFDQVKAMADHHAELH